MSIVKIGMVESENGSKRHRWLEKMGELGERGI